MSGYWEIKFRSRVRGPISDGRMQRWVQEYEEDCAEAIADEAQKVWVHNLKGSIRHPTPYYWTRIDTREITPTRYEVHDHGIVYGPWLEGTGSRNAPVTIFPGYFSLRRAKETMKRKRSTIARRILRRYRAEGKLI
jgi:hypothetical protein